MHARPWVLRHNKALRHDSLIGGRQRMPCLQALHHANLYWSALSHHAAAYLLLLPAGICDRLRQGQQQTSTCQLQPKYLDLGCSWELICHLPQPHDTIRCLGAATQRSNHCFSYFCESQIRQKLALSSQCLQAYSYECMHTCFLVCVLTMITTSI